MQTTSAACAVLSIVTTRGGAIIDQVCCERGLYIFSQTCTGSRAAPALSRIDIIQPQLIYRSTSDPCQCIDTSAWPPSNPCQI